MSINANSPSILLCTGWQTTNIGDMAFTPAMLRMLEKYVPEARVVAWVMHMDEGDEELYRANWPEVQIVRGTLDTKGNPISPELKKAFEETDLFLYNSGPLFSYGTYTTSWDVCIRAALPLFYCRSLGKPYGIYAQSFDGFAPPSGLIFKDLLSEAAFVFTRETHSLAHLKEIGVCTPVLDFAPDADFGFDLRDEDRATTYLDQEGLKEGQFLVVNILSKNWKMEANGLRDGFMEKMRELIINWVRTTHLPVLIAPEQVRELTTAQPLLVDFLPADVRALVHQRTTWWLPSEARSVFSKARALIGMEPHSAIMALTEGVPSMHLSYKGFGYKGQMFDDIGLGEWLFDIEKQSSDEITEVLLKVDREYSQARAKVAKAMQWVRQSEADAMGVVKAAV